MNSHEGCARMRLWQSRSFGVCCGTSDFGGLRFRRQQPIGPYVVEFYCSAARLVIELDGGQHGTVQQLKSDTVRTNWLNARGYRVLRFWNGEILKESEALDFVWRAILEAGIPLPQPLRGSTLPQGEGSRS
jgi:adenine-specific DNA-methyltransferase